MLMRFATAVTLLTLMPTTLLAHSKAGASDFSGVYQMYGQRFCVQNTAAPSIFYTGTWTFLAGNISINQWNAENDQVTGLREKVPYSITGDTISFDGASFKLTFRADRGGVIRTATLITAVDNPNLGPCSMQTVLFR